MRRSASRSLRTTTGTRPADAALALGCTIASILPRSPPLVRVVSMLQGAENDPPTPVDDPGLHERPRPYSGQLGSYSCPNLQKWCDAEV